MRHYVFIDAHSQIYRAIFSPGPRLTAPSGEPTKGVYTFLQMITATLRSLRPTHVVLALDGDRNRLERRRWYPDYKAQRSEPDPETVVQVKRIRQILAKLSVPRLQSKGWEADDILATLVRRVRKLDGKNRVTIISRDKDLYQLVTKKRVVLYDPISGERVDSTRVRRKWGVAPKQIADVLALMGDSSDNVPGVIGIGEKTARQLIVQHGSIDSILEDPYLPKTLRSKLEKTDLDLMRKLVRLNRKVPVPADILERPYDGLNLKAAAGILKELGIRRLG